MRPLPTGRVRPVLLIVAIIGAAVVVLHLFARGHPAFQALIRDVTTIVVSVGIVLIIRALVPRREQRRHGERRHASERRSRSDSGG